MSRIAKTLEAAVQAEQPSADLCVTLKRAELYRVLMQVPATIAITSGPQHIYEFANPAYLKVLGKTTKIIGKSVAQVFPDLGDQGILDILDNVYRTGEVHTAKEFEIQVDADNDGRPELFYFNLTYQPMRDATGTVEGIMSHAVDVSDQVRARRRAEKNEIRYRTATAAAHASEEHFRFLAESLPQLVFTADPAGRVEYYNSRWTEYTGVPMKRLKAKGVRGLLHPDDVVSNLNSWFEALRTGEEKQTQQRLRRADGKYHRFVSYVRPMRSDDGTIVRWFGSITDIEDALRIETRKKRLEVINAALKEQRAQLVALNAAKDEFISLASHQLRTPATGVKQYLGMALDGFAGEVDEDMKLLLSRAYDSNERQITVINDLLKVAQVDAGKVVLDKKPTDLGRMVKDIVADQASKLKERRQTVDITSPASGVRARVDPARMRMVLENLIDNASKYTTHGKRISMTIAKSRQDVTIVIRDQGVGISPDDMDKLFRKFSRLDNPLSVAVGGTGLGLYWAKKIIDLHGGTIAVDSVPGKSTAFTVTLPVV